MAIDFQEEFGSIFDRRGEKKSLAQQKVEYQAAEQSFLEEVRIACNRPEGLETGNPVLLFSSSTEVAPARNRDTISRRITAQRTAIGDIRLTYVMDSFRVHYSAGTPHQLVEWRKDIDLTSTAGWIISIAKRQKSGEVYRWDGVDYSSVSTESEKPTPVLELTDETSTLANIAKLLHQERENKLRLT